MHFICEGFQKRNADDEFEWYFLRFLSFSVTAVTRSDSITDTVNPEEKKHQKHIHVRKIGLLEESINQLGL